MTQAQTMQKSAGGVSIGARVRRYGGLIAFFVVCLVFAIASPTFTQPGNILNILENISILLVVSLAMTTVIAAGGIDLSVGIALDLAALVAVSLLEIGVLWPLALLAGLAAGALLGAFNSLLVVRIGISPFLATLGTLFIGQSIQRIYTHGGEPIYLRNMAEGYKFLGRGDLFGIPFEIFLAGFVLLIFYLFIERTIHGKRIRAVGLQRDAARRAGLRVTHYSTMAYIISGLASAVGGIILSASGNSYVPLSGGFYLLDSIGAVFIGTTIDPEARPNVLGTLLGVLFFGVVANGLNLVGINFYWKTVAKGVLIFLALILGALNTRRRT
jgi:ribose transport system permease protein